MSDRTNSERPSADSLKPLRTLVPFLLPYKATLFAALGALLVASAAVLALPIALRFLIDNGFVANDVETVNRYFGWFFAAAVAFGGFGALRFYLVTWLGERVVADIRNAVYERVIHMDPTFFEITRTGEVLSRLTTDTTLVQSVSGVSLSIALRSTLNLIGGLVMLALTSVKLTLYIMIGVPVIILPIILVGRKIRNLSRKAQDRVADTSGLAGETLNAMQTVQAFTLEALQIGRFKDAVQDSFRAAIRRIRMRAGLTAIGIILVFGAITVILWLGSHAVLAGDMSGGQLAQFLMYSMFVGSSAAALSELWGEIQRGAGAMERLTELLQAKPAISAPENPDLLLEPVKGKISFKDVSFRYPSRPDEKAMDSFSLDISPGETLAIVGPSGAGKSTSFQLLLRFYDPESGSIEIDGQGISRLTPFDLRSHIGLVPQETVLFGESARENIRYGRPDATEEEIHAAASAAAADEFISLLPEGYDTFLGERGTRLSGGQRQRIAIARAILKDPPVLLLDEATSSLDAESERLVQGALEGLMENRTTIIIAHRLATVKKADRIVVMDQGRIVAIGTHDELTQSNELYARLAALQFGN
ncbi:MAG: ATP-binding cassette subfamily B protein [Lysobacterales bacterium]|jgi:ATP-binding cassette subfamily B protein